MTESVGWYYVEDGNSVGPVTLEELKRRVTGQDRGRTLVWGPSVSDWTEARHVAALTSDVAGLPPQSPRPRADEIDFVIHGDDLQFVEVTLDPGEVVVAEAGAMLAMTEGIEMKTVFGDPSEQKGILGKLWSAGQRMLTGESLFLTVFGCAGDRRATVSFAAPYPGKIVPVHLDELGGELICQKDAFLCAARGVTVGIAFQRRFLTGLFGGEGFILQRLRGDGVAFLHAGGTVQRRELTSGETLRLDTGCLVALQPSVSYDIEMVSGIKNAVFGGEGLFLATLRGPGLVWIQSLPFARLAGRVLANLTTRGEGEGSVLGKLANVFERRT